ncbi:hypothetical protein CPB86DRAFT_831311 [Serendipita vermifera]|nr:hypothetical protein CPB86DRAFT_831311 [Serendipita vermifera]
MADAIERAVSTWMLTKDENEVSFLSQEIQNGSTTLLALIKVLGESLTSEESERRVKGVSLLAEVITKLSPSSLNRQSTKTISAFFISKLDSLDELAPALKGLLYLSSLATFMSTECRETIQGLSNINMKAHTQPTRHLVFSIVDSLLLRHRTTLQSMEEEFVKGYIKIAEGEKDPRNLLLAFALDKVLLLEFDVSKHIESFYDITFCYFPITFKAPANDPHGVTGASLVNALRDCLKASPLFGPLGMPLFIEKLNAGSPSTKCDTLDTVASCIPVYGKAVCLEYGDKLWDGLKIEIFQPVDVQVQEKALEVTKVLMQTCYPEQSSLEGVGLRILRNCLEILNEPTTTRGQAAIKVIMTFISCSNHIASLVLDALVPQMTTSYDKDPSTRQGVLAVFAAVLDAMIQVKPSSGEPDHTVSSASPLQSFKDGLLSRFISGLESGSTAEASLLCLHRLVQTAILSVEELVYVVQNLTNTLLNAPMAEDDLTIEILALLQFISTFSPKTLEDITLPSLFALLPDQAPSKDRDDEEYVRCVHALTCLGSLCIHPDLFSILVVRLLTKIELLMGADYQDQQTTENAIGYAHALLKTLYSAALTKYNAGDPDLSKYIERFIPRLYFLFFTAAQAVSTTRPVSRSQVIVADAAGIIALIVASLNQSRQELWAQSVFDAFFNGKFDLIAFDHSSFTEHSGYDPLQTSPTKSTSFLAPLFAAAMIGLRAETRLPTANINDLLDKILNGAVLSKDSKEREALTNVVASLLNKHAKECSEFVNMAMNNFWGTYITPEGLILDQKIQSLGIWKRLVQALMACNHPSGVQLARQLLLLFDDKDLSIHASRALGSIPNLGDSVLNHKTHAIIRLLHAQKLFNAIVPEIRKDFQTEITSTKKAAHLTVISVLISSVPKETYSSTFTELFPLMMQSLQLEDVSLRTNIIQALVAIIEAKGEGQSLAVMSSHLGSLVPVTLRNTQTQGSSRPCLRMKSVALRLLAGIPDKMKQEDIQPYKSRVLRELQTALDDPSKGVRRDAVVAR